MKKPFLTLLTLFFLVPGCTSSGEHSHTYYSTWSWDEEYHWHAASCEHSEEKKGYERHTFGEWTVITEPTETTSGTKYRECSKCPYTELNTIPPTGGGEVDPPTPPDPEQKEYTIQDMNILHAWNWKLNDIKTRLSRIKKAGYGAIQISPMQPHVDGANGAKYDTQNNWWKLYQPLGFKVATGSENILGTKQDLASLCTSAEAMGLKIVVDVVCNHLAGTDNNYSSQVYKKYPLHNAGKFNDDSVKAVVQGHIGLPDLDTSNKELQNDTLSMMKEYIDCGVSGFRFDAAKHIETPSDGDYASDYWPTVLGGTTSYALSKGLEKPYYYGEILGTCGKGRSFDAYTSFMSVVDSRQSGDTLEAVEDGNMYNIPTTYSNTNQTPDKLVLWAESHDNYANTYDDTTRYTDISVINKAYVIQASRKDAATLYYARPSNMSVTMCTIDDLGGWQYPTTKAINKFHSHYVGEDENVFTQNNCFMNIRGEGEDSGITIVNMQDQSSKSLTISALENGTYVDLVSKEECVVSNHSLTAKFTDGVSILIPKKDYIPEEEDPSYTSSLVIEDAPSSHSYIAWVWGNGSGGAWRAFNKDQSAIGISLSSGEEFTIVEFPSGTTTGSANWNNMIRQTKDMSYSGGQQIISFSSLSWK